MPAVTRSQLVAYALAAIVVTVLGVRYMHGQAGGSTTGQGDAVARSGGAGGGGGAPDHGQGAVRIEPRPAQAALVHVAGAVQRPGVYRMRDGDRIKDAVRRAGGVRKGGDLDAINLAAKVADGQQVVVPRRGASAPAAASGDPSAAAPQTPVSLNAATAEQLDTLDGVGPATARKILDWRREHGGFRSIDDLGQVPGIGPKKLAALRDKVQL
jgi:competence protein ComEA